MESFKELVDKYTPWLRFKKNGDVDMNRTFEALLVKTVVGKESSFTILGIRCNSKESTGKRKMEPGRLYKFLQGYHIAVDSITIEKSRLELNSLYDDYYTEINDGKPHIQVTAIVGHMPEGQVSGISLN